MYVIEHRTKISPDATEILDSGTNKHNLHGHMALAHGMMKVEFRLVISYLQLIASSTYLG